MSAHQGELIPQVVGHDVLTTLAAGQGEQSHARTLAAGFIGEHAAILVVGVGDDHHDAGAGAQLAQRLLQRSGAAVNTERLVVGRSGNGGGDWGLGRKRGRGDEAWRR